MGYDHETSDKLFRLGWLGDEQMADTCLNHLAGIAEQLIKEKGVSESDTSAIFVEPLLRGLGWETLEHNAVDRAPGGGYPDYELFYTEHGRAIKRVAIIEVKALETDEPYLRTKAYEQLYRYVVERLRFPAKPEEVVTLSDKPILCGVVTNGKSWHIYDFHSEGQEPKCEFELQDNSRKRAFIDTLGREQLFRRLGL